MNNTSDFNVKEFYEALLGSLEDCSDNLEKLEGEDALDYLTGIINSISAFGLVLNFMHAMKKEKKTQEDCCCQKLENTATDQYRQFGSDEFSIHFSRRFGTLEKSSAILDIKEELKNS